jgi:hypothetical protein
MHLGHRLVSDVNDAADDDDDIAKRYYRVSLVKLTT